MRKYREINPDIEEVYLLNQKAKTAKHAGFIEESNDLYKQKIEKIHSLKNKYTIKENKKLKLLSIFDQDNNKLASFHTQFIKLHYFN